ncbi:hypothetical protein AABB24_037729 [Solanum stoloniferum]|uniref:TFIIB-type domain-containing protein n=1 Tax=Solanum stoloniferum TaxID=62892 RepID=A0ABD2R5T2_9SOLN
MGDPYCSDCKRNTEVVFDHAAGDTVCSECELVLESRSIDETSEWRTFADESGDHDPNRVGGPVNPFLGDVGLSIVISKGPNGSNGDSSLARLQNRGGDPERALVMAFKAIANMADRLSLVSTIKACPPVLLDVSCFSSSVFFAYKMEQIFELLLLARLKSLFFTSFAKNISSIY